MVVIRLARFGTKHKARYRITVADSRRAAKGKFIEIIGNYNPDPSGQEKGLTLDVAKANEWIKKGAQPTPRVKTLLREAQGLPKASPEKAAQAEKNAKAKAAKAKPAAKAQA